MLQEILVIMILPSVLSYHFYNPRTYDIITLFSLKNIPAGYRLLPAPKSNTSIRTRNRGSAGICTDAGFTCSKPYQRSETVQFECDYDSQCPASYKCCPQKCFVHKICSRALIKVATNLGNFDRPGTCQKWPYQCRTPYHYALTSMFECNGDGRCPRGYKCCEQSCFSHRICSKAMQVNNNAENKKPSTIFNEHIDGEVEDVYTTESNFRQETEEDITSEDNKEERITDTTGTEASEDITNYETEVSETVDDLSMITTEVNRENEMVTFEQDINTNEDTPVYTEEYTKTYTGDDDEVEELTYTKSYLNQTSIVSTSTEISSDEREVITHKPVPDTTTHDSNAIVPEYSEYYYHYGEGNDTDYDYDYKDNEDDE